jgi:hypothetical protein
MKLKNQPGTTLGFRVGPTTKLFIFKSAIFSNDFIEFVHFRAVDRMLQKQRFPGFTDVFITRRNNGQGS